jgi:uncharacterized Zn-binding protein involved in type VI secretion
MPGLPIAVTGDKTTPPYGPPNAIASITPTVLAGGRPVITAGAIVAPHGNYTNPKAPGYNPTCKAAKVLPVLTSTTVFIEGKPVAMIGGPGIGSICSCMYHNILGPGVPTVLVGL